MDLERKHEFVSFDKIRNVGFIEHEPFYYFILWNRWFCYLIVSNKYVYLNDKILQRCREKGLEEKRINVQFILFIKHYNFLIIC